NDKRRTALRHLVYYVFLPVFFVPIAAAHDVDRRQALRCRSTLRQTQIADGFTTVAPNSDSFRWCLEKFAGAAKAFEILVVLVFFHPAYGRRTDRRAATIGRRKALEAAITFRMYGCS